MSDYQITYTNERGATANFDSPGDGYALTGPLLQTHMPPARHTVRPVFGQPGGLRTHTRLLEREIVVPLAVYGEPGSTLASRMRSLAALLDPQLDGLLRLKRDTTDRHLKCRYADGFDGTVRPTDWGPTDWWEGDVTFVAFDPYWHDAVPVTTTWTSTSTGDPFFDVPFLPFDRLKPGITFASADIEVTGDEGAWPVWNIYGSGTNPVVTNTTTGETLDFRGLGTCAVNPGERIRIDTTPGNKTVMLETLTGSTWVPTTNYVKYLTDGSSLFDLRVGHNVISFTITSPTSTTSLALSYQQRYLSP